MTDTPDPKTTRRVGAPPGNTNALKHGFYSRRFQALDIQDLAAVNATIDDEINALRVAARRVFEYASEVGETDPLEGARLFGLFGNIIRTISGLLRTQAIANGDGGSELARAAIAAIAEVAKGWE